MGASGGDDARMKLRARPLLGPVLAMTILVASAPAPAVEPRGTVEIVRIKMVDNRFRPANITIEQGTVVKWRNRGDNVHTTTSDTGVWDSGTLSTGESFRRRFRRTGTFEYHCSIHLTMTGTITVT
jgi:plastocyanin